MKEATQDRAEILGEYILDTGATVRAAAKVFKISKSTVHKDITERLWNINNTLAKEAKKILDVNKANRHNHRKTA